MILIMTLMILFMIGMNDRSDLLSRRIQKERATRPPHVEKTVESMSRHSCYKKWRRSHASKEDLEAVEWLLKHNFIKVYDYTSHQVAVQSPKWLLLR